MSRVPSASGHTSLLDLGANLHVSAYQLVQFAIMGAVACPMDGLSGEPKVALLNVGHEVGMVTQLKVDALRAHAVAQINCPTRHYYIQSAKELEQCA